jgi:hypothetical protein
MASLASPPNPWVWWAVLKESFFFSRKGITAVLSRAKGEVGMEEFTVYFLELFMLDAQVMFIIL